jgi:hypothetical protein
LPVQTQLRSADGMLSQVALAVDAELLAVPFFPGPVAPQAEVASYLSFTLEEILALHEAKGEPGEIVATPIRLGEGVRELLLYGVGDMSPSALRRAGAALARRGKGRTTMVAGVPGRKPGGHDRGRSRGLRGTAGQSTGGGRGDRARP